MSPIYDWSNPFLRNMPLVAIVRQTVKKNGETVITPDTECKRVFVRVKNNRVHPVPVGVGELLPTGKAIDSLIGFDDLQEFNPTEINADRDLDKFPQV